MRPRIKRVSDGWWHCSCGRFGGLGTTPKDAYYSWLEGRRPTKNYVTGRNAWWNERGVILRRES